jgi:hypothetical protein
VGTDGLAKIQECLFLLAPRAGLPRANDFRGLDCQTILSAHFDPKRVFPALSNLNRAPPESKRAARQGDPTSKDFHNTEHIERHESPQERGTLSAA